MSCCNDSGVQEGINSTIRRHIEPSAEVGIGTIIPIARIESNDIISKLKAWNLPAGDWSLHICDHSMGVYLPLFSAGIRAAVTAVITGPSDFLAAKMVDNTFDIEQDSLSDTFDDIVADASSPLKADFKSLNYNFKSAYFLCLTGTVVIPADTKIAVVITRSGAGS